MKVVLLSHTPDVENLIACAGKLCYSSCSIEDLQRKITDIEASKFIDKLLSLGHESPLEHCTFTFGIEGASRTLTHQLVRHRIASYSHKSQRYVSEIQFEYVTPPTINAIADNEYNQFMNECQSTYQRLIDKGIPREDARYVLPNACSSRIIATMNIRSLFNFFKHRCCNRAQWEIRELAYNMLSICKEVTPTVFKNAGASCISGHCPEGEMSCKRKQKQLEGQMTLDEIVKEKVTINK